eukprot:430432_1
MLIDCIDRIGNTEETKREDVLNNALPKYKQTVFHVLFRMENLVSLELFEMIYEAYRSEAKAKEALFARDKNDRTALEYLEAFQESIHKSVLQKINEQTGI